MRHRKFGGGESGQDDGSQEGEGHIGLRMKLVPSRALYSEVPKKAEPIVLSVTLKENTRVRGVKWIEKTRELFIFFLLYMPSIST